MPWEEAVESFDSLATWSVMPVKKRVSTNDWNGKWRSEEVEDKVGLLTAGGILFGWMGRHGVGR